MAEGLAVKVVSPYLSYPKLDELDDVELLLNNLTTAFSCIEESVRKPERDASVLASKFKNTHHSGSKRTQGKPELLQRRNC